MPKGENYYELWSYFEYFLHYYSEGINLKSFHLISDKNSASDAKNDYYYEKITRSVIARNARRIKRYVKENVEAVEAGQTENEISILRDSLKHEVYGEIRNSLNTKLIDHLVEQVAGDDRDHKILLIVSIYYAYYKNRSIPGFGLEPGFLLAVVPFLFFSQKNGSEKITAWQQLLQKKILSSVKQKSAAEYDLKTFFEDKDVRDIVSRSFAAILAFIKEEPDRALYFFEVTHNLKKSDLRSFQMQIANGLYTSVDKEKRFVPKQEKTAPAQLYRVKLIPEKHLLHIVQNNLDQKFNEALTLAVDYYQSCKLGKMKKHLLKNYDRLFLGINKRIWKDIRNLIQSCKQDFYRTRYLLRVIIHYLFENRGIERDFWVKYIPSVERIINFIYRNNSEVLIQSDQVLNTVISRYRGENRYQGTDWLNFYRDSDSKKIALKILHDIVEKGRSDEDEHLPAVWFSCQTSRQVDYTALYRHFRQGVEHADVYSAA